MASRSIQLVRSRGDTSISIDVAVDDRGDVVLSGQDLGAAPEQAFGDREYEYIVTIRSQHKDALLLALLEQLYRGDDRAVSKLRDLLEAHRIPSEFHSP